MFAGDLQGFGLSGVKIVAVSAPVAATIFVLRTEYLEEKFSRYLVMLLVGLERQRGNRACVYGLDEVESLDELAAS